MSVLQKIYELNVGADVKIDINELDTLFNEVIHSINTETSVDIFCNTCGKSKSFKLSEQESYNLYVFDNSFSRYVNPVIGVMVSNEKKPNIDYQSGLFMVCLYCPECKVTYRMGIRYKGLKFTKIFEFPDQSTRHYEKYRKFRNIDDDFDYFIELATASRLFNNSAFIGSFVYLRRCLEHFVKVHLVNKFVSNGGDIHSRDLRDFSDYVELVSDYIPSEIKDAIKDTYSIMSSGIHELNEDECKDYYELMLEIITILLQTECEDSARAEKFRKLRSESQKIKQSIEKRKEK